MLNLLDYLKQNAAQSFTERGPNDVDAVILARLSYLPYELVPALSPGQALTLGAAAGALMSQTKRPLSALDQQLLQLICQSTRYFGLELFAYESKTDIPSQTQFAAVAFRLCPGLTYLAFRGTDNTLVGWKEDFNMTFVCPVPAQELALAYTERLAAESEDALILGGHSKGGNLAVYGAAFCSPAVQARIRSVYNFDGPGFDDKVLQAEGYRRICQKIRTLVPQSSIVGMMLGHEEEYTIIHSSQHGGLFQHSVYTWEVENDGFCTVETVTGTSRFVDTALKSWLADMDAAQREVFIDTVYSVLAQSNAVTLQELGENKLQNTWLMMQSVKGMDEQTRAVVQEGMKRLLRSTKFSFVRMLQSRGSGE